LTTATLDISTMVAPNRRVHAPQELAIRCRFPRRKQPDRVCGAKVATFEKGEEELLKSLSLRIECPSCSRVDTLRGFLRGPLT